LNFLERVLNLIKERRITKNKLLIDLKLSKNSFVDWESRGTIPSGETIVKLAEYFGVSCDYLLTGKGTQQTTNEKGVIGVLEKMDAQILNFIKYRGEPVVEEDIFSFFQDSYDRDNIRLIEHLDALASPEKYGKEYIFRGGGTSMFNVEVENENERELTETLYSITLAGKESLASYEEIPRALYELYNELDDEGKNSVMNEAYRQKRRKAADEAAATTNHS